MDFGHCDAEFFLALCKAIARRRTAMLRRCATTFLILTSVAPLFAGDLRVTRVSKPFFNPSLGQDVAITVALPATGRLTALVVDRDGYPVRYLFRDEQVATGEHVLRWDGRDATGAIVPDEAYSLKLDLLAGKSRLTYFPAHRPPVAAQTLRVRSYDPRAGIVSYELPVPSRVHIQAGSAVVSSTGKPEGPVLKTVVDEQPRIAGSVVESWNGFDESGTIYVPDQPHFVMSLVAAPLPENSIITVGNRARTFLEYVAHRHGTSLVSSQVAHANHAGLQAIDDVAPPLRLTISDGAPVRIIAELQGPIAARFARRSEQIEIFVAGKRVATRKSTLPRIAVTLPPTASGSHIVALNWVGRNGPVAVNALRLITPPDVAARQRKD